MTILKNLILIIAICLFSSCSESRPKGQKEEQIKISVPIFNADSAYKYVKQQCDFGPRVPGTSEHAACLEYLASQFKYFGADTVIIQEGEAKIYNGGKMPVRNVIASYNLKSPNRILISSHWDSRPYADKEEDSELKEKPIIGANDGASGVGVILEIARQLSLQKSKVGVDLILFDLEDYGAPDWKESLLSDGGWALGSKYWSKHPHKLGYKAQYGILLDMVGAKHAKFYREYFSERQAGWVVDKVWNKASEMGLHEIFINEPGGAITDDHLNVINAGIPCIDIIQYLQNNGTGFGDYWHTHKDNIEIIDKKTLKSVGQLMLELLYNP